MVSRDDNIIRFSSLNMGFVAGLSSPSQRCFWGIAWAQSPRRSRRLTGFPRPNTYVVCILELMADALGFDWDQANTEHIASHQVTPEEVEQVFANDEMAIDYDVIGGEERWTPVGETDRMRVLIVVFTVRDESVRTVTAYEAGPRVRSEYLAAKGR